MTKFGNFIWFILGGAIWAISMLILAGIFAITIIGLPIARACLEFAKLAAFPFGKAVIRVTELYGKNNVSVASKVISVILNIIWFPLGLIIALSFFSIGIGCFVSIIGIPFGIAYFRMGKFCFLPMGARVVRKEEANEAANKYKMGSNNNIVQNISKKCRQCGTIYSCSLSSCPKCNSSLYEEMNQIKNPRVKNIGDTWTCKSCGENNPTTSSSCKGCGGYK
jgi:uncharacterized membrane protein YccF (DUF307 family)